MSKHLYVHIPFCTHICAFCDFFRVPYQEKLADSYLLELEKELQGYVDRGILSQVDTLYIGGGTPSALTYSELERLLKILSPYVTEHTEYTLEANPEHIEDSKVKLLRSYGVNRISLGIQCLQDDILTYVNRKHTATQALDAIDIIYNNGITNISADMIYGLPKQTTKQFIEDLEVLTHTKLTHISMYSLTIEENSAFGRAHQELVDNELEGEMYEKGRDLLELNGFHQYEVANYAREERYESMHNKGYWLFHDYVGAGMGAVGYIDGVRYENTRNFQTYLNGEYILESTKESQEEQIFLMLMMGLRLKKGIRIQDINERFSISFKERYKDAIGKHIALGNISIQDGYMATTPKGMEILHDILLDFMD
ncbi:MAG: radical SAM family heme chaperone HemW [Erysipelotrichaceae bacterium]|nr:radical SAM family heme chaperone HemW [Erysipelotrichaceae bacterium]